MAPTVNTATAAAVAPGVGGGGGPTSSTTSSSPGSSRASRKKAAAAAAAAADTSGVLDYLRTILPRSTLLQLYTEEARGKFVCRAILQQCSPTAQQVVVRLSCTGGCFSLTGIQVWTKCNIDAVESEALEAIVLQGELERWAIIEPMAQQRAVAAAAGTPHNIMVKLTEEFQIGLRASMSCLEASPWSAIPPQQLDLVLSPQQQKMTPEDLERYTQDVWDAVLHFLVGTVGTTEPPKPVVQFLLQTGLMQVDPDEAVVPPRSASSPSSAAAAAAANNYDDASPLVITEKGYDFMLQDNQEQVWTFVVQYLDVISSSAASPEKGQKKVREALLLLICLSYCRVGQAYPAACLSKSGQRMLRHFAHFGLLYVQELVIPSSSSNAAAAATAAADGSDKQVIFYPTRVATQLLGSTTGGDNDDDDDAMPTVAGGNVWSLSSKALNAALAQPDPRGSSHLAIIVQTNFQVCAYTTSELHISMLGLFCDVQTIRRLPNVVFMTMTRQSVKSAFNFGIQARQILRFLEKHAHPKLRDPNLITHGTSTGSPLPSNVVDQVWLWDRQRTRVTFTEVAVHQCLMEGEYQAVVEYAKTLHGGHHHDGHDHHHHHGRAYAWSSERQQKILINYAFIENIQDFVRKWRSQHAVAGAAAGR